MSAPEQHLKRIDKSRSIGIHCFDDRGYLSDDHNNEINTDDRSEDIDRSADQNLKVGGAASYGLAYDTYAARMLAQDGQFEAEMPAGELAKIITKGLAHHALLAALHETCAAEQSVRAIGNEIVINGEAILDETNRILDGNVKESDFNQLQNFYDSLRNDKSLSLFRGVDVEAASMEPNDFHSGIKRSSLAHADHRADTLFINTTPNTWFDAAEAYANGAPLYHYDSWAVPVIGEKINTIFHHDNVDGFVLASLVRTIAIARLLPRDEHHTGVDIIAA